MLEYGKIIPIKKKMFKGPGERVDIFTKPHTVSFYLYMDNP